MVSGRAQPQPESGRAAPLGSLARAVLRGQSAAYQERHTAVLSGGGAEAVRRMRVTARRLRAALRFFAPALPRSAARWRPELRWIAAALGQVRDLDVLLEQTARWQAEADPAASSYAAASLDPAAPEALCALLYQRRAAVLLGLQEALASPRHALLISGLAALLDGEGQRWPAASARPAAAAFPALLARQYRRLRRAGDALDARSPAAGLHALRIQGRRLRYALEFAGGLYGAPAQRLVRRLTALQDLLGAHQDAVVAAERLDALRRTEPAAPADDLQALLDALICRAGAQAAGLRARFAPAYARLRGAPWKRLRAAMRQRRRALRRSAAGPTAASHHAAARRRKPQVELYLVRHAIAEEPDPAAWPDDRERPLTPEGVKRFRLAAEGLRTVAPEVERVLSSPLTRAWQTAGILAKRAGWPAPQRFDPLAGDSTPEEIVAALQDHAGADSLALVGHEPGLHELASYLLTGGALARLEFKKGSVACFSFGGEVEPGAASLRWLLTPKLLRMLTRS